MYNIVINHTISQKNSLVISSASNLITRFISITNILISKKTNAVDSSRIGYIADIDFLQYLHFHKVLNQEKIGIRSYDFKVVLQLLQWLLPDQIHFSHDFSLWIRTEEKLQKSKPNMLITM